MEVGIFDHVDRGTAPLSEYFNDRLAIVELYDRIGIRSYHVAEHHFTPLGIAASPAVYLAAVAQRTQRLRFGPMVFCLPLYHPLRLAEEVCMLDQMSGGRFELGVGRGISPLESRGFGNNPDYAVSQKTFIESLEVMQQAMAGGAFTYKGEYRHVDNVEMILSPFQKPHPPLWMGVHSIENVEFAAKRHINVASLHTSTAIRDKFEHYRTAYAREHGSSAQPGKTSLGLFIVVGETDAEAMKIAQRAYKIWHKNFHYLYHLHGRSPVQGERPNEFQTVVDELRGVAGTPDKVADFIEKRLKEATADFLLCQFVFGDMTPAEALGSIELFGAKVMPSVAKMKPVFA